MQVRIHVVCIWGGAWRCLFLYIAPCLKSTYWTLLLIGQRAFAIHRTHKDPDSVQVIVSTNGGLAHFLKY